ncbi:two-component regulator propeller domain-containing protein [uncultured Chitinophaga sp.]|uniref:ligand-binding sensor domain-containing protein n=1 Tax=uncultured Chitinophaga sp. TaxID=339340 RepID=UPI0025DBD6DE|nr:sensor histidine kinase [uncultured Chitinophaga sp.]
MKPWTHILLSTLLAVFVHSLYGQSYNFRHYQVENGLSNNATICCLQDHKGFMWFGTKDGLNRFDGYTFKVFRHNQADSTSIGSNFIHSIYEDGRGILWAGTEKGLYRYDASVEKFNQADKRVSGPVRDIKSDRHGRLWFIMGFTLYRFDPQSGQLDTFDTQGYFEATSICMTPSGHIWVSTRDGLLERYDEARNTFTGFDIFSHSPGAVSHWIEKIYCNSKGQIFVGTSNQGAKIFDSQTHSYKDIITYNEDKTALFARNFVEVSPEETWIATESGIYVYHTAAGKIINIRKKYNDPYSLSDNAVYSFWRDKEGGIWAGTYFGGINYFPNPLTPFAKYYPKMTGNAISGNIVREIKQDAAGNLWIGTEDAGLNKLDTATGLFTPYQPTGSRKNISYNNIHGLLVNGNEIWIGTFEHGLDVMDARTGQIIRHYSAGAGPHMMKSNFIYYLTKTGDGQILAGTTRGAYVYRNDGFDPLPNMPANNWYTYLLKDSYGVIWAATYGNGINYSSASEHGNLRQRPGDEKSLSSDRVTSVFEDSKRNLWFTTEDGLCLYNRNKRNFTTYTTEHGLPSNFTLSILEDDKSNLWVSTTRGLARFNPAAGKAVIYNSVHGTLGDQFNFNSAYKDATGRMYFGSVKGMISFHPDELKENEFAPPVYITGFQVFDKELRIGDNDSPLQNSVLYTKKITLPHDQSTISIDFAALSYAAPDMSEYAYVLEGQEKSWTYLARNRKAYFTELPPGDYLFKVKASVKPGVWNQETALAIKILPPWWASNAAYFAYFISTVLVISFGIKRYHEEVEKRNNRKYELLERAKEKEIFQAKIVFFTNVAHEIRTPLTLIKAPLEKVMTKATGMPDLMKFLHIMEKNTNRLVDLTNQLLDFRKTEINGYSLSFVKADIGAMLEETYYSFKPLADEKHTRFHLHLPPEQVYAYIDMDAFNKIIYNLFSNAIKFGDVFASVQLLPVDEGAENFSIRFSNDGPPIPAELQEKIFEPFYRMKDIKQPGTGIGLALSRSLAKLHNGSLYVEAHHQNVFLLTLPVHQATEFNLSVVHGVNGRKLSN